MQGPDSSVWLRSFSRSSSPALVLLFLFFHCLTFFVAFLNGLLRGVLLVLNLTRDRMSRMQGCAGRWTYIVRTI